MPLSLFYQPVANRIKAKGRVRHAHLCVFVRAHKPYEQTNQEIFFSSLAALMLRLLSDPSNGKNWYYGQLRSLIGGGLSQWHITRFFNYTPFYWNFWY